MSNKDKKQWLQATKNKMDSLDKNDTCVLVDKPKYQKIVECKWIQTKKGH